MLDTDRIDKKVTHHLHTVISYIHGLLSFYLRKWLQPNRHGLGPNGLNEQQSGAKTAL